MTPRQRHLQRKTAAYEALDFIRRFYPWREMPLVNRAVDRYCARLADQMIRELSTGCLPLLVRREVTSEDSAVPFLGMDFGGTA